MAADQIGQAMQGLRTEDDIDIGRTSDDGLAFLAGDTAADADDQLGIVLLELPHAAQLVENLFLRLFTHRAGVEENDVCVFRPVGLDRAPGSAEHVGHLVRIVLVHLAPEGADEHLARHQGCAASCCERIQTLEMAPDMSVW